MAPPSRKPSADAASLEDKTRSERGFASVEAALASVFASKRVKGSKMSNILSYLGARNPLPVPITGNDIVWLLDNVAFRGPGGAWQAEFVAAAFAGPASGRIVDAVSDIAEKLGFSKGDSEEETIEKRVGPFVMGILPGRQVKVRFDDGAAELKLGPGGRNGISSDIKVLTDAPPGLAVDSTAEVPSGTTGLLEMKTVYAEPHGWAVISDIDDTIKITQTNDPLGILRSTFVSEPTPVTGMPELYAYIKDILTPGAPFFYLSASPYNLYPFLRDFRETYYPHGQLILRDASWMTIPGLLSNLTLGTQEYKVDRIKKVHRWLPQRKLICIGDSTQTDPESYGEIYRTFPGWVKLILIRKVKDIASVGTAEKNEPKRFEVAFKGVPRETWHVFEDPSECIKLVQKARSCIAPTISTSPATRFLLDLFGSPDSMAKEEIPAKRQRSAKDVPFNLIYWPGLPGRGEHVRLALEEVGADYTDTAHTEGGIGEVLAHVQGKAPDDGINPPIFAPPILKHGDLVISQTPNILLYLGRRLGLVPSEDDDPDGMYRVNALALTALDGLSNEPHDCHHPIASELYYEDQKDEGKRKAEHYIKTRLPKFLSYFEHVLTSKASGDGPWLYGGKLTYADLVLFQCLDGVKFMFPKAMAKLEREEKHSKVFALYEVVKARPKIKAYLESPRRQKYSNGIYRYYKEFDIEG
ncbi:hypothetical protein B0T24DRAFT_527411 [Lasiosphaeria ovina]|uniref:Glutathione S-transferase n=1 Tax=Lasiosphaeria ovina TaxID=92902 RepID=A0AAE0KBS6_9PEZI|nr:hypothetical protein B0T24DRAFT_527411 [Lasiosphaeria ovina]